MEERVRQLIDYYNINPYLLERKIFVSEGTISKFLAGKIGMKVTTLVKIMENFPDISTEWLVLGRGEMLRKNAEISENTTPKPYDSGDEPITRAAESSSWPISDMKPPRRKTLPQPQPSAGCPWERYDRAMADINSLHEEIGSLRERLTQASATIASLKVQLDNQREKTPSPSATTATEPILV